MQILNCSYYNYSSLGHTSFARGKGGGSFIIKVATLVLAHTMLMYNGYNYTLILILNKCTRLSY